MKGNIFIIDDHPLISKGLGYFLIHHGYSVTSFYSKNQDIYEAINTIKPEIIVLDINMPEMNGIEMLRVLRTLEIDAKVIIFTGQCHPLHQQMCESAGAAGFVHKSEDLDVILNAIKEVTEGRTHFPKAGTYNSLSLHGEFDGYISNLLTRREIETLRFLMQGHSVKDISDNLNLSNKTVSTYKQRIIQKLGSRNLLDAIDTARAHQG